jgi:hypothetical protein
MQGEVQLSSQGATATVSLAGRYAARRWQPVMRLSRCIDAIRRAGELAPRDSAVSSSVAGVKVRNASRM